MNARQYGFSLAFVFAVLFALPAHAVAVKTVQAPSGMDVWLSEEHSLPVVAISVSLPAGSAFDPAGKEGLASMTASLLDEGAGDLDGRAFKEAFEIARHPFQRVRRPRLSDDLGADAERECG